MVTAGDSLTVLNSKDIVLKNFTPPNYLMGHSYNNSGEDALTLPKYTQIRYSRVITQALGGTKQKITTGLIGGTDKGSLHLFTYPFNLDLGNGMQLGSPLLDQLTAHAGEVTKILLSPDNRYLFSAGTDGTLFIFQLTDTPIQFDKNGMLLSIPLNESDPSDEFGAGATTGGPLVVDEALADIVLVRKQEMEEWRRK